MISILMSVYKEPENYLRQAVESILTQTFGDFEYLIVLDNPENEIAKNILLEYAKNDVRIHLIFNKTNMGLTKSLNRALALARGEFIARMDADDISDSNRFQKQLIYLELNDLDLIGCSIRRISEEGEIINAMTNKSYPPECVAKLLRYDNYIPHPSWLGKKEVFIKLNGYRNIDSCEDYDFLLRCLTHGYKVGICDSVLVNYRINSKGISRNNSLRQILTSHYLQTNLHRIDSISVDEIEGYIGSKNSMKAATRYECALVKLNKILAGLKHNHYLRLLELPILVIESKYVLLNYAKIFQMQLIKNKYS